MDANSMSVEGRVEDDEGGPNRGARARGQSAPPSPPREANGRGEEGTTSRPLIEGVPALGVHPFDALREEYAPGQGWDAPFGPPGVSAWHQAGRPTGPEDHWLASRATASERSRAARVGRSRPCDRGAAPVARGNVPEALRGYLLVGRAATAEAVELARIMLASNASSSEFLRRRGGAQAGRSRRRHPLWWPSARTGLAKPSEAVARRTKSACGNDGFSASGARSKVAAALFARSEGKWTALGRSRARRVP